jgi:multiple sugar transport system permease protein
MMARQLMAGQTGPLVQLLSPRRTQRLRKTLGRDWKVALPFVLPLVILMVGLILWPFINAMWISMTVRSAITREDVFVGLQNYQRLWLDSDFRGAVLNSIRFTVWSVSIKLVVGLSIALLLNGRLPFRNLLTGLILLPWVVPEVVTAFAWRSLYDPLFGGLNPILQAVGLLAADQRIGWLSDPKLAMPSVIAVNVWKGIPFFTMLLLAGLKAIDRELYEAAEVDGADAWQRFRHITLPGLRYVMAVTLLLSTISTFNGFGLVYLLTAGGPAGVTRVYSILAYERAILGLRFGPGSAVAFSMAPVLAIFIILLGRYMRHDLERAGPASRLDRIMNTVGGWLTPLIDLVLWPFDLIGGAIAALVGRLQQGRAARRYRRAAAERQGILLRLLILVPFLLFVLFPFYWMIITAFKTDPQIRQQVSLFWPNPWTLDQFVHLLTKTSYLLWLRNTLIVAVTSTTVAVSLAALAGYALARLKFTGAGTLTTALLISYLLPDSLLFIPLYRILTTLGIIDTHLALIVTYPTFLMPFATWVMLGYYRSIPEELEDAAMIDGATRLRAFFSITLPLATPALLAVTLFAFTQAWNEFLFAFVFLTRDVIKTLPVGLQLLVFGDIYPWGILMCASLLMAIPVAAVYVYTQRYAVESLTAGSVKG